MIFTRAGEPKYERHEKRIVSAGPRFRSIPTSPDGRRHAAKGRDAVPNNLHARARANQASNPKGRFQCRFGDKAK
jgi:hypothetical protein